MNAGGAKAQITAVNPTSATAGQTINMIITGAGTSFSTVTGAELWTQGASITASSINAISNTNMTATFNLPPNAPLGNYAFSNYQNILPNALTMGIGPGSAYSYLRGTAIHDVNQNCVQDAGDT
ncbi:MAG: hypothetical protein AAF570_13915, partial [Bacteroidota bacterium]